ncbi:MAG: hypothetical protein B7Z79_09510 [Thiomonas sp. 20-64-9]|nr:MAG: hypothetical protein B7Z79_09510 [Thiomonas sp. 20-64-9]
MFQLQPPQDERQLVAALTEVLRQQRQALVNTGSEGAAPVTPIWQPLLQALEGFAQRRRSGDPVLDHSLEITAEVTALRDETLALQHTLSVWSAALQQAITQSQRQAAEPTYGPASGVAKGYGQTQGQSLGRG